MVAWQSVEVCAGSLQDGLRRRVVEQREQQVFDRHVLVARLAGVLVALADGVFEILAEHGAGASGNHYNPDGGGRGVFHFRSEEHTSELRSLMRISYAVFCLKKKNDKTRCRR